MHQTQWSAERPLPPPVSLTSQSHHEKPRITPHMCMGYSLKVRLFLITVLEKVKEENSRAKGICNGAERKGEIGGCKGSEKSMI